MVAPATAGSRSLHHGRIKHRRRLRVSSVLLKVAIFVVVGYYLIQIAWLGSSLTSPTLEGFQAWTGTSSAFQLDLAVPLSGEEGKLLKFATMVGNLTEEVQRRLEQNQILLNWKFRLLVTRFQNDDASEDYRLFLASRAKIPEQSMLFVPVRNDTFSRGEAINALQQKACDEPKCHFLVVDVDMRIGLSLLTGIYKYIKSSKDVYFPITFSEYNPDSVVVAERLFGSVAQYSHHRGIWRDYGYGMLVTSGWAARHDPNFSFNTKDFQKWGGEDADLFRRISALNYTVHREREHGLIHTWHPRLCIKGVSVSEDFYSKCIDSGQKLEGSTYLRNFRAAEPELYNYILQKDSMKVGRARREGEISSLLAELQDEMDHMSTASFDNCTGPIAPLGNPHSSYSDTDILQGRATVVVSCHEVIARFNVTAFRNSQSQLLVGVTSPNSNAARRQIIRQTWAAGRVGVFFLVDGPWDSISAEFQEHGDVFWVDQGEARSQATVTTASFFMVAYRLQSVLNLPFTHVLKTEDSSYVALDRLGIHIHWLSSIYSDGLNYWGRCSTKGVAPDRNPAAAWHVSVEEYPKPLFPPYCQGLGFVVSRDLLQCGTSGHIQSLKTFRFDDVYMGMVAERCDEDPISTKTLIRTLKVEEENMIDAEMAGRLIQAKLSSDADMMAHHKAMQVQQQRNVELLRMGDIVEVYVIHNDRPSWILVKVVGEPSKKDNKWHVDVLPVGGDFETTLSFPFMPYMGEWRKPDLSKISETDWTRERNATDDVKANVANLPLTITNEKGIARDHRLADLEVTGKPSLTDSFRDRFIVVPEYKLLFCYVEKVGCRMFNHLFRLLRLYHPTMKGSPEEAQFQAYDSWYRNTPSHHGLGRLDLERILVNPKWTKAIFYRDPSERFLSAFRSKCEGAHRDGSSVCKRAFGVSAPRFSDALKMLETDSTRIFADQHFSPTINFCGGLGSGILDLYDFVHELDSGTAPDIVSSLFQRIGVDPNTSQHLVDTVVRGKGTDVETDAAMVWNLHGLKLRDDPSSNQTHNTDTLNVAGEYYRNARDMERIEAAYSLDYDLFQIPRHVSRKHSSTVLIGITTSRMFIGSRARAVASTWGSELPFNVIVRYFVGENESSQNAPVAGSPEDIQSLANEIGLADPESIVVLKGVPDEEYPLVQKAASVLKHLNAMSNHLANVDWIVDVDDDTYVHWGTLKALLDRKDASSIQYLGRRGRGRPEIRNYMKQVGMTTSYCMGGPGFALSKPALNHLATNVDSYIGMLNSTKQVMYDDVIFGICMHKTLSIGCWDDDDYERDVFYQVQSSMNDLVDSDLLAAATVHDLKDPKSMIKLHDRVKKLHGQKE